MLSLPRFQRTLGADEPLPSHRQGVAHCAAPSHPHRNGEIYSCDEILGNSPGLLHLRDQIEAVGPTDATVLIHGETGVGKELVARGIHQASPRHDRPMVRVNCTAVPHDLFESEFFGHVRGAFTGAMHDRAGRFRSADGGTLFLDEVGELPLDMQPKLLRVLEEAELEAVGDDIPRQIDVRVIAASNRDLQGAIQAGHFRQDLYYRLNVFPIDVPPLRNRRDDIAILATAFLEAACDRFHRPCQTLTDGQLQQLSNYPWPGNVRELRNVVERAVIKEHFGALQFDIPGHLEGAPPTHDEPWSPVAVEVVPIEEMNRRHRDNLLAALRQSNGRIYGAGGAADLLGLRPTTLTARLKKLGLKDLC